MALAYIVGSLFYLFKVPSFQMLRLRGKLNDDKIKSDLARILHTIYVRIDEIVHLAPYSANRICHILFSALH